VPFPAYNNAGDGFLVGIDPQKSGRRWHRILHLLRRSSYDQPTAMQFAPNGNLYIAGFTSSTDFPNVGNSIQRGTRQLHMFLMAWDLTKNPSDWIVYSPTSSSGDDIVTACRSIQRDASILSATRIAFGEYKPEFQSLPDNS